MAKPKNKQQLIKLNNTELTAVANDVREFFIKKRKFEIQKLKKSFKMTQQQQKLWLGVRYAERYSKVMFGELLGRYGSAAENFKELAFNAHIKKLESENKITKVPDRSEIHRSAILINASRVGSAKELAVVLVTEFTIVK
jgi:hypothetical protein